MLRKEYYITSEVAKLMYVSPKTVSRWAVEGRLKFVSTLGGHRRYEKEYIDELIKQLREENV